MRETLVQMRYFGTYYYANIVHNILDDPMSYVRNLNDWHEGCEAELFLQPFPKISVLHDFTRFIIHALIYEVIDDIAIDKIVNSQRSQLWIDQALSHHEIHSQDFRHWLAEKSIPIEEVTEDHIYNYHGELGDTGKLDKLLTHLSNEVFFILFGNRALLANLNDYISLIVQCIEKINLAPKDQALLRKDGVPTRAHIPEWVRRAVFFRDRGMCAACNKDLSGLVTVNNPKHFDHIIPLANGGINDVTNIQLLCETCNLIKGRKPLTTSNKYEAWYT